MKFQYSRRSVVVAMLVAGVTACGGGDTGETNTPDTGATVSPAASGDAPGEPGAAPLTITAADLDGFEKGIARETELVRAASEQAARASTPQARGEAIQAGFEDNTMAAAAPVTGLSAERYKLVRQTLSTLLTTLDFQGVIDGPQSLDTTRADAAAKARMSSDPYAALDPAGAALLKQRLGRITPLWIEYINLTAVGG